MQPGSALTTLEGSRIRLRAMRDGDLQDLFAVYADREAMRYWSHPAFRTLDQAAWYLRDIDAGRRHGTHFQWAIALRDTDALIGSITLFALDRQRRSAQVAYIVARAHCRQGHACAALQLLLDHAFQTTAIQRIEADIDPRNDASIRLLEKLGFVPSPRSSLRHDLDGIARTGAIHVIDAASHARSGARS